MPGKAGQAPVLCDASGTGSKFCEACSGDNADKPTYPYGGPLSKFVGRLVDSNTTGIMQNRGMRTLRGHKVRVAPARGAVPARVYMQLGETLAAYSLGTFFNETLQKPMIPANQIPNHSPSAPWSGRNPFETVVPLDAYFYPEHKAAEWQVPVADGFNRLTDFDFDDRGNVYVAEREFGWGIVKDTGDVGSKHLRGVQVIGDINDKIIPTGLFVLKAGSGSSAKYHVFVTNSDALKYVHFNATDVNNPSHVSTRTLSGADRIARWAKDDEARVVVLATYSGALQFYNYDDLIANRGPFMEINPTSGRIIRDIAFDENGVLWAVESVFKQYTSISNPLVRKFTRSGSGYTETVISGLFSTPYGPSAIYAAGGYVAIFGYTAGASDMQLFKVEGNGLRHLDTDDFFRKYYHQPPAGYASPGIHVRDSTENYPYLYKHTDGKTYLFYQVTGLSDVFELEGSGINASMLQGFGSVNPNAPLAQTGPFPGDAVSFKASSSSGGSQILQWIFDNPEAGGPNNIRAGTTGVTITHQFTGLDALSEVNDPKTVTASLANDSSTSDSVVVNLKVPTARIALKSTGAAVPASDLKVVLGDKFVDGSDGSVEGHYAEWTITPQAGVAVVTPAAPNTEIPVGLTLGNHTVSYKGFYGKQADPFTIDKPFETSIASRSYTVLPFLANITAAQRTGTTVTYDAVAQFTADAQILPATQWTYTWTLTNAANAVTKTASDVMNKGTNVPAFPIELALLEAANGGKVTLQLSVATGGVTDPAYATFSTFVNVKLPNITIVRSNCTHQNNDCAISATSTPASDAASWQLSWVVKRGTTTVKTGTGNPLATFKLLEPGTHTVTVTENVFGVEKSETFEVLPTECGPPPPAFKITVVPSCTNDCPVGQPITFTASIFQHDIQDCDEFLWSFGDGGSASGREATHTYTSNGTYTVKLTIRNSSNPTGTFDTETVKVGTTVVTPTCTAPSNATYTTNCVSGSNCRVGNTILFTARRNGSALQSCDSVQWTFGDGNSSTDDRPSHVYSAPGDYPITVKITNQFGSTAVQTGTLSVVPGTTTDPCSGGPSSINITLTYNGPSSGCSFTNTSSCTAGESIAFDASIFGYTQQACDKFEWNFGDNGTATTKQAEHTYTANGTYLVKLKIYSTAKPNGVTVEKSIVVGPAVPAKTVPTLAFSSFPTAGSIGAPVTFTVNVTNGVNATGWSWDFGDGVKDAISQKDVIDNSVSIQHTYTKAGTFPVSVKARNAEDLPTAQTGVALGAPGVVITDIPEYKFLLPVVTHGGPWRTDVQIYTPDTTVSPQNPLVMHAALRDITATLEIRSSTYTYEDFVRVFTPGDDFGPSIITVRTKVAPQIWTRTYNQTDGGTYGQFIPAIRIDAAAGGSSAFGTGKYYLAGLRHGPRFRTNLGFVNPNPQAVNVTVKVFDDTRQQVGQFPLTLQPYQLDQFPITHEKAVKDLSPEHPFSLEIEVPAGQWLISYASYIDNASNDPVYLQAVRASDLSLAENANLVIPGVGHVGEWRSDVTIFNPDTASVTVDLAYHDQTGAKVAEAKGVLIHPREFVQYTDILKQGVLGSVGDSTGILRVTVTNAFPPALYPLTYARTYNDKGIGKTFGQGIGGFAAARANVKPGKPALVAGIRSNSKYYTNVGVVNVSSTVASVTVKLLDPISGAEQVLQAYDLNPNQSVVGRPDLGTLQTGSLKVEVTGGSVWAFASIVDKGTQDPEYVAATPLQ